jgi:hypothetical protein
MTCNKNELLAEFSQQKCRAAREENVMRWLHEQSFGEISGLGKGAAAGKPDQYLI